MDALYKAPIGLLVHVLLQGPEKQGQVLQEDPVSLLILGIKFIAEAKAKSKAVSRV